jgi:hypothetical protein
VCAHKTEGTVDTTQRTLSANVGSVGRSVGRSDGSRFLSRLGLGLGLAVPQLEDVCNVINFVQGPVEVHPCVTSRDAKASSGHENGHGGKANYHNRKAALQALARKGSNLGRVVKHHGHDRRVELAQHIQTHFLKAHPKVIRIVAERLQLLFTNVRTVFSHDNLRRLREEERHVSE